ncbi:MAG: hypothetical protein WKF76_06110 [Nocardioidaceae bacterium]
MATPPAAVSAVPAPTGSELRDAGDTPLTNLDAPRLAGRPGRPAGAGAAHDVPPGRRAGASAALWTYAEPDGSGGYRHVGGGDLRRRDRTPGARAPSTPTTWPGPPSSTCATGRHTGSTSSRRRGVRACCAA